ncbi:uncharacterized protein LOC111519391 [Drosophila willistoni]|uniref:uncharacterized protein LOC111519391 n=1 Tax=Drosophila willistoni TaxID=7260 RepID=UPI000C26CE99|nr:uncharacterized protein LOC111519391 [Drosophila willistoni]
MLLQSLCILWLLLVESWCSLPKNYKVRLESFNFLANSNSPVATTNIRLLGRERALNGTITILEDLDNEHFDLSADAYIDPTGGGDYKQIPFTIPKLPVCEIFKNYIQRYGGATLKYNVNTDFPFDGSKCPIPTGTYYFKNVLINTDGWPQIMPIGILKGVGSIYKDNEIIGTLNTILIIESIGL